MDPRAVLEGHLRGVVDRPAEAVEVLQRTAHLLRDHVRAGRGAVEVGQAAGRAQVFAVDEVGEVVADHRAHHVRAVALAVGRCAGAAIPLVVGADLAVVEVGRDGRTGRAGAAGRGHRLAERGVVERAVRRGHAGVGDTDDLAATENALLEDRQRRIGAALVQPAGLRVEQFVLPAQADRGDFRLRRERVHCLGQLVVLEAHHQALVVGAVLDLEHFQALHAEQRATRRAEVGFRMQGDGDLVDAGLGGNRLAPSGADQVHVMGEIDVDLEHRQVGARPQRAGQAHGLRIAAGIHAHQVGMVRRIAQHIGAELLQRLALRATDRSIELDDAHRGAGMGDRVGQRAQRFADDADLLAADVELAAVERDQAALLVGVGEASDGKQDEGRKPMAHRKTPRGRPGRVKAINDRRLPGGAARRGCESMSLAGVSPVALACAIEPTRRPHPSRRRRIVRRPTGCHSPPAL